MSRENAQAIRAAYARAAQTGDRYADADLLSEDFRLRDRTLPDVPDEVVGIAAYNAYVDHLAASFKAIRYDIEEVRELDDRVLLRVRVTGAGRDTGIELQGYMGHLWTFNGSRAVRADIYGTWAEALEAVGLRA